MSSGTLLLGVNMTVRCPAALTMAMVPRRQRSSLIDFEALGPVPEEKLRQAAPASIQLKTAPAKADTLLPEDQHYQACCLGHLCLREGHPNVDVDSILHTSVRNCRPAR